MPLHFAAPNAGHRAKFLRALSRLGYRSRACRAWPASFLQVADQCDWLDELIPPPRNIDDEAIAITAITQGTTQGRNMDSKVGGFDECIRPHAGHEVVL